jgi:hypothetical protein
MKKMYNLRLLFIFLALSLGLFSYSQKLAIKLRNLHNFPDVTFKLLPNGNLLQTNNVITIDTTNIFWIAAIKQNITSDSLVIINKEGVSEIFVDTNKKGKLIARYKLSNDSIFEQDRVYLKLDNIKKEIYLNKKGNRFLFSAIGVIVLIGLVIFLQQYFSKKEVKIPIDKMPEDNRLN